jgi:electron transfer flavoprotein beta subunit
MLWAQPICEKVPGSFLRRIFLMTLKVAVIVKQVPDHEAIVQLDADGKLDIENRYVCSFFDEIAIEQALAIKKSVGDVELLALSAGGKRATEALRRAVAMGIDNVERIGDDTMLQADSFFVAAALGARLKEFGPQLVLAGKLAGDDDMGAVGPMVAEMLGMSNLNAVIGLEIDVAAQKVSAKRTVEGGQWTVETGFPVLLTTEKGLVEPHIPVVMRVMKAMKAKIAQVPLSDLDLGGVENKGRLKRLRYLAPQPRPEVKMVDDVSALVEALSTSGALA